MLEYAQPKKKLMLSDTERWVKLAAKVWPFRRTLDEYLEVYGSECTCASLQYAPGYETVALTIPREVLSLARKREKAGKPVSFKPAAQQHLTAPEMTVRLRALFLWIQDDMETVNLAAKGAVELKHVLRLQFLYKHFLRLLNHWNYCHSAVGGGLSVPMMRNFMQTVSDRHMSTLLGLILNELDFLRGFLGFDLSPREPSPPDSLASSGGSSPPPPLGATLGRLVMKPKRSSELMARQSSGPNSAPGSPRRSPGRSPETSPRTTSRASSEVVVEAEDRRRLLGDIEVNAALRHRFLEFARTKFAEENVLFFLEVRRIEALQPVQREPALRRLCATYLDSEAEHEVNLSSRARKTLMAELAGPTVEVENLSFLQLAVKEVETQLLTNLCDPFLKHYAHPSDESASSASNSPRSVSPPLDSPRASSKPPAAARLSAMGDDDDSSTILARSSEEVVPPLRRATKRSSVVGAFGSTPPPTSSSPPPPSSILSPGRSSGSDSPGRRLAMQLLDASSPELRSKATEFAARVGVKNHIALYEALSDFLDALTPETQAAVGRHICGDFIAATGARRVESMPLDLQHDLGRSLGQPAFQAVVTRAREWVDNQLETLFYQPFIQQQFQAAISDKDHEAALAELNASVAQGAASPADRSALTHLRRRMVQSLSREDLLRIATSSTVPPPRPTATNLPVEKVRSSVGRARVGQGSIGSDSEKETGYHYL